MAITMCAIKACVIKSCAFKASSISRRVRVREAGQMRINLASDFDGVVGTH